MAIKLYQKGYEHALELIKQGKVDLKHHKVPHHGQQEVIADFIKDHSIDTYGTWCLATNKHAAQTSPEHYLYPFGDFNVVQKSQLLDIETEAHKHHHLDVVEAVKELIKKIDKK